MNDFQKCERCGCYDFASRHKCDPFFRVHLEDWHGEGADGDKVFASDFEEAAEKWADWYDQGAGDYTVVGGDDVTVTVKDEAGETRRIKVSGEATRSYTANVVFRGENTSVQEGAA